MSAFDHPLHSQRQERTSRSFIRFLVVNAVFASILVAALLSYHGHVHPAGKLAAACSLVVFCVASFQCGRALLRGASAPRFLLLAMNLCTLFPLIGAAAGFLVAFQGSSEEVPQKVSGAAAGLAGTIVGLSCLGVLWVISYLFPDEE